VELEEGSVIKHEFLDGVVYAMAGGSPAHAGIAASVIRLLGNALARRRCRVFTSDLRVRVEQTGLATYPDASVVSGELRLDPLDAKGHTVLNPTVVVEVLSPSTEWTTTAARSWRTSSGWPRCGVRPPTRQRGAGGRC